MATRTPYEATAGATYTAANHARMPRGWVAYVAKTSNQTGISADADITGLTTTLTLTSGRRYKVSVIAHVITTSAGGLFRVNIDDGGRVQLGAGNASTTETCTVTPWLTIDGDNASHTIKAVLDITTAGTYTVLGDGEFPSLLLVEDIGPSS